MTDYKNVPLVSDADKMRERLKNVQRRYRRLERVATRVWACAMVDREHPARNFVATAAIEELGEVLADQL